MFRALKFAIAATALTAIAVPAMAQEEERTTYQITFYKFTPGGDVRWNEAMSEIYIPAREAVGLPVPTVHWMVGSEWNIMTVTELTEGMAGLDTHGSPTDAAMEAEMLRRVGSQAALDALDTEMGGLVRDTRRVFSHTHP